MQSLNRLIYRANRALIGRIIRPRFSGTDLRDPDSLPCPLDRIVYVLENRSLSDLTVLDLVTERQRLPGPHSPLDLDGLHETHRFLVLNQPRRRWRRSGDAQGSASRRLQRLVDAAATAPVTLIPVAVLWGRAPGREGSFWRLLFSENWAVTSRLKRLINLLISRHDILVQFGAPLALAALPAETQAPEAGETDAEPGDAIAQSDVQGLSRVARMLRIRLRDQKVAALGPDLSHQRTLIEQIVRSRSVREIIDAADTPKAQRALDRQARRHARSIASNLSYPTIRVLERLLRWFWNRIYNGVTVRGMGQLAEVAERHTIVYVPSHRSHVDYLLLSYLLYQHGLMIPHIAAGDNLNLPVVGGILRRGGAFFMRRSFRDDRLYAAVFAEYLYQVYRRGHSVEFFPEGGRTRTGRLLPARLGLLKMTLEHSARGIPRPLAFVPVYLGYEKLVEAGSYLDELRGAAKERESVGDVLRSLRLIRQNFGRVAVAFGRPLILSDWLAARADATQGADPAAGLGNELLTRINDSAEINPVNLVALVTLSMPRAAIEARQLEEQITCYQRLLAADAANHDYGVSQLDAAEVVAYVESMGMLQREPGSDGDVLGHDPFSAVLMTWYRNNVAHTLALPSLIACLIGQRRRPIAIDALERMVATIYPYIAGELHASDAAADTRRWVDHLIRDGLLREPAAERESPSGGLLPPAAGSSDHRRLRLLARVIMPTLERLYIVIGLLAQGGEVTRSRQALQQRSEQIARRMSRLYGLNAPEFFDRRLFDQFVDALIDHGVLSERDDGTLSHRGIIEEVLKASGPVIDPEFRYAVLQEG
ncbi:MAG: glycerol-3-phosphate 1-O-acyltransferase PlsB [Pseudomonadales bacterium]